MAARVTQNYVQVLASSGQTYSVSASTTIAFSYTASVDRLVYGSATTLILLSYVASENSIRNVSGSHTITFHPATNQVRDAVAAAGNAFVFSFDASQIRDSLASASNAVTFTGDSSSSRGLPASASSSFDLSGVDGTVGWHVGEASSGIDFSDSASETLLLGSEITDSQFGFSDSAVAVVDFVAFASDSVGLSDAAGNASDFVATAANSIAFNGTGTEIRDAVTSSTNNVRFSYVGAVGHRGFYVEQITFGGDASAVRITASSASSAFVVSAATASRRNLPRSATSSVAFVGLGRDNLSVHPSAASAFNLAGTATFVMAYHPSSSTSFVVDGSLGHANLDKHPGAANSFALTGSGTGLRAANSFAVSTIHVSIRMADIRILHASAETTIRLHDSRPLVLDPATFGVLAFAETRALYSPIGGNPMAAQYVGYIGQFQQGQTMTLMLRSVGYSGQLVMPDAPPSATIYDDSGNAQVFSLPASDQANSIFSLPIFLGLTFPLGRYRVYHRYSSGGDIKARADFFEVIPGGDPGGAVISVFAYDRPEAGYVLAQLGSGMLVQGRNPRI